MNYQEQVEWCGRYKRTVEEEKEILERIESVKLELRQAAADASMKSIRLDGMPHSSNSKDLMTHYMAKVETLQKKKQGLEKQLTRIRIIKDRTKTAEIKAFKKLPWKYEQVMMYRFIHRKKEKWYTVAEISGIINRDESTVKRRLAAAVDMLKVKDPKPKPRNPSDTFR